MFGHQYFHNIIKDYVIVFGTLFNEITIQRTDSSNNVIDEFKVPLSYGPRDKMLARVDADPDLNRQAAITLPRMSFELVSANYDNSRKLSTIGRTKGTTTSGVSTYIYNPVPYNFTFQLSIAVKNAEDGTRIVEQILPFFTPEWNVTLQHVDSIADSKHDVPVILQSVTTEDQYTDNFETRRALLWNLDFVMKGYLYGPAKTSKVVTRTIGNLYNLDGDVEFSSAVSNTNLESVSSVTVDPGQNANGAALNYYGSSNGAANVDTVSRSNVDANDDIGYITSVTTSSNGGN